MNIIELKKIIADLPDDMEIGYSGHFGEMLECFDVSVMEVKKHSTIRLKGKFIHTNKVVKILGICIEQAGEEPS